MLQRTQKGVATPWHQQPVCNPRTVSHTFNWGTQVAWDNKTKHIRQSGVDISCNNFAWPSYDAADAADAERGSNSVTSAADLQPQDRILYFKLRPPSYISTKGKTRQSSDRAERMRAAVPNNWEIMLVLSATWAVEMSSGLNIHTHVLMISNRVALHLKGI
jgi:hypothetical protein